MKTNTPTLSVISAAAIGCLAWAGSPALGQSAEGLDTPVMDPQVAKEAAPAPSKNETPVATTGGDIGPSRFAGDEVAAYVRQLTSSFSVRGRVTDPFGRYQDPDYVAPQPKVMPKSPTQKFSPEPPMPFADIVAGVSVNTVIPAKQQFLIADRIFKKGDVFPLRLPNGKQVSVQVLAVTSSRILFRNLATSETAPLDLNLLPSGMQKGTGKISAPGVEAAEKDAPIDIQPVTPLSNNR